MVDLAAVCAATAGEGNAENKKTGVDSVVGAVCVCVFVCEIEELSRESRSGQCRPETAACCQAFCVFPEPPLSFIFSLSLCRVKSFYFTKQHGMMHQAEILSLVVINIYYYSYIYIYLCIYLFDCLSVCLHF